MIKAAGAKQIGRAHVAVRKPCQDAFKTRNLRNKACIALADGAGSRRHSREGANAVVGMIARWSLDEFDGIFDAILEDSLSTSKMLISRLVEGLTDKANGRQLAVSEFASTLVFFACDRGRYLAGHIGDGAIIAKFGEQVGTLSEPDNGEFANNTYFVTDPVAHQRLRLYAGSHGGSLSALLMTDGVTESLYDKTSRCAGPGVARLFAIAEELPAKEMKKVLRANLEKVISLRTGDDCSIATLVVSPPAYTKKRKVEVSSVKVADLGRENGSLAGLRISPFQSTSSPNDQSRAEPLSPPLPEEGHDSSDDKLTGVVRTDNHS